MSNTTLPRHSCDWSQKPTVGQGQLTHVFCLNWPNFAIVSQYRVNYEIFGSDFRGDPDTRHRHRCLDSANYKRALRMCNEILSLKHPLVEMPFLIYTNLSIISEHFLGMESTAGTPYKSRKRISHLDKAKWIQYTVASAKFGLKSFWKTWEPSSDK